MRESRFRDASQRSPPQQKFRNSPINKQIRPSSTRSFSGLLPPKPERTLVASPVVRPDCDNPHYDGHGDDRSRNISQSNNKTLIHGKSASSKFHWNNLLEGKFDNAKWPMKHVGDFDGRSYGTRAEKACQGYRFPDLGVVPLATSIGTARNYRHIDGGFTSPVGKKEVVLQSNSEFPRPWEQQHVASNSPRRLYNQDGGTIPSSRVSLGCGIPISQAKIFPNASSGNLKDDSRRFYEDDNLPRISLGLSSSIEMADGYCAQDGHFQIPGFNSTDTTKVRPVKMADSAEVMDADSKYSEIPRSEKGDVGILPDDILQSYATRLQGDYRRQDFRRSSIVDSIVDRIDGIHNSHGDALRKELSREENLSTGKHLNPKYYGFTNLSNKTEHYVEAFDSRNTHPEFGTAGYKDTEDSSLNAYYRRDANTANYLDGWKELPVHYGEYLYKQQGSPNGIITTEGFAMHDYEEAFDSRNTHPEYGTEGSKDTEDLSLNAYRRDANTANYVDSWKELPVHYGQCFYKQQGSPNGMLTAEELAMHDLDGEMFKLKGSTNETQIWKNLETRVSRSQYDSDTVHDLEMPLDEDIVYVKSFDKLTSPFLPVPAQKNSRNHKKIVRKSVKKRLTPGWTIPLPNPLLSSCRNVHERLGPRVVPTANLFAGKHKKRKKLKRNGQHICESSDHSDLTEVKVKLTKTEPPEDSKEFKQLVHNAFLKFVKLLNENTDKRTKYTDQVGIGTLKCGICSSKPREFVNTQSLAMHLFQSSKAGCRVEHLGFHKALCLLLGWSDTAAPDGSWIPRMLPATEASALKNDLIIWPPVVLVHNSSIAHNYPGEQLIVSIEGLEAILVGMGFGGGKTKVSRGKHGNHVIFVVTFNATFSGLQEAERLDKFYADDKHGRAEFLQMGSSGQENRNEKTQYVFGNKESVLYGYLGIAGDLDKLDFGSKKHSVVKSKKEIQAIADATLMGD